MMTVSFHGPWLIEVASKRSILVQRYVIAGSVGSDGSHPAAPTLPPLLVDGATWTIELQWLGIDTIDWVPSEVREAATNTLADGLVVTLGANNIHPIHPATDRSPRDFKEVVLQLRNQDPALNPWVPFAGHPDFTVGDKPKDSPGQPPAPGDKRQDGNAAF